MESTTTVKHLEDFWIRLYLGAKKDLISAVIDRAYLDFNRTQHGFLKVKTSENYAKLKEGMVGLIAQLLESQFESQEEFDEWHECKCNYIIDSYDEHTGFKVSFGQAQKWINMSLKYLYALGESRVPNISTNFNYFHIPIDNIIQERLKSLGVKRINGSWSRLKTYEEYFTYQRTVRDRFPGRVLMDIEFELFNQLS